MTRIDWKARAREAEKRLKADAKRRDELLTEIRWRIYWVRKNIEESNFGSAATSMGSIIRTLDAERGKEGKE